MTDKCCNYLNSWLWSTWPAWPTDRFNAVHAMLGWREIMGAVMIEWR